MTADLSVEINEATLFADDGASEIVKEFKSGKLSLGVDNIGIEAAKDLTGAQVDENGVLISSAGDSITFSTPTIEGTISRRNKLDGSNNHPWKAEANEGDTGVSSETISKWFTSVYEPSYTTQEDQI